LDAYIETMKPLLIFLIIFTNCSIITAQSDSLPNRFWKPVPRNYMVKSAIEIESLVPMFITGGYHVALGYRYKKIRIRASIINGATMQKQQESITVPIVTGAITLHLQAFLLDITFGKI
jgi:hypothetical protein